MFWMSHSTPEFRCLPQPPWSANWAGEKTRPGSWEATLPLESLLEGEGTPWTLVSLGQKCHPVPQAISITTAGDGGQGTIYIGQAQLKVSIHLADGKLSQHSREGLEGSKPSPLHQQARNHSFSNSSPREASR